MRHPCTVLTFGATVIVIIYKLFTLISIADLNLESLVVRVGWKYLGEISSYREAGTAMHLLRNAQARTVTEDS